MKAIDPRLFRYAKSTRSFFVASVVLGAVNAILLALQAIFLAKLIASAFPGGATLAAMSDDIAKIVAIISARAVVVWLTEVVAFHSAASAKSELRKKVLFHLAKSTAAHRDRKGEISEVVTRGIDALDGYFSKYLSQLVLAVLAPVILLAVVLRYDVQSFFLFFATIPAIPVFMILIGKLTQSRMHEQFHALTRLSGFFLEIVRGLPTLRTFNKAAIQQRGILAKSEDLRIATMRNLRLAFLSGLALELLATLGVAFVAVSVGFRLVDAKLSFETALIVLILAPEVYAPLRQVGAQFHANVEGLTAAEHMFTFIEQRKLPEHTVVHEAEVPDVARNHLRFDDVTFAWPMRFVPALEHASFEVLQNSTVVLTGKSGSGKSSAIALLLKLASPNDGKIWIGATDLAKCDAEQWRRQIAWVPQRTHLFSGTVADNVLLASPQSTTGEVEHALERANALSFVQRLPHGMHTDVGQYGALLSAGERQRIALARAFLRDSPLVLLDEPTEHLDEESAGLVIDAIKRLCKDRTAIISTHSPVLKVIADSVVTLRDGSIVSQVDHINVMLPSEREVAQ